MFENDGFNRRAFLRKAQMTALAGAVAAGTPPVVEAATTGTDKYDFDTPYNRIGSDCIKWDRQIRIYGRENIAVGMGIADMDFRVAPAVTKALARRIEHENWGYLDVPESFSELIIHWNKRRYGIDIRPDQLLMSTGVHPSIVSALRAFSARGSKVLINTPIYDGFYGDIAAAGCVPEECAMKLVNGRYQLDFEEFERHISDDTKTVIFCNPQNPTGNTWSAQDMTTLGEICLRRRVVMLVDEIHCDFVTKGNTYTPFNTLTNQEIIHNSVTFKSASKSFSLSAMKCGWMFSYNPDILAKILAAGHSQDFNTLGMIATMGAYTEGEDWLNHVVAYIDGNHEFAASFIRENMPLVKLSKAQGTYLTWPDIRGVAEKIGAKEQAEEANRKNPAARRSITPEKVVEQWFVRNAKVQINAGSAYGHAGAGHMRMNIATSRKTLQLALSNMAEALKKV
jgi:cystathionine beta-lyase